MKAFILPAALAGRTITIAGWDFVNGKLELSDEDGVQAERVLCRFHNCTVKAQPEAAPKRLVVIVGLRISTEEPERLLNALHCLRALDNQSVPRGSYEIILVEEAAKQTLPKELKAYADRAVFLKSDASYNRGRVFNYGVAIAELRGRDTICLIDADILAEYGFIEKCRETMQGSVRAAFPYRFVHFLRQIDTPIVVDHRFDVAKKERKLPITGGRSVDAQGGSLWIQADLYAEMEGHDERFVGWGCEDMDFLCRLQQKTEADRLPGTLVHMWHRVKERGAEFEANRRLFASLHPEMIGVGRDKVAQMSQGSCSDSSGMRILWLTVDRGHRVARIFQPLMEAMQKLENVTVFSHRRWSQWTIIGDQKQQRELDAAWMNDFDIVFTDAVFGYMKEEWDKVTILKCCLTEDCHGQLPAIYVKRAYEEFGFDVFFYRYREGFEKYHPYVDKPKVWLPHSIDPVMFYPVHKKNGEDYDSRNNSVLSVGVNVPQVYPLRHRADIELQGMKGYRRIERPPEGDAPWPIGKDYADFLRASKIVVSGCSMYHYPILKTFEIPACGAVLACDPIGELTELGFEADWNYITLSGTQPGDVRETLEGWLKSERQDELNEMAKRGHQLVHRQHTAAVRARELQEHFQSLLATKQSSQLCKEGAA